LATAHLTQSETHQADPEAAAIPMQRACDLGIKAACPVLK
jgi:hypothetical protein